MLFDRFIKEAGAAPELCTKYRALLPADLVAGWEKYGFGSLLDGYLKMVNPEDYRALLRSTYALGGSAIPIFVTAFADIITWEKGRYIRIVQYKDGTFDGIASDFYFFWEDLESGVFDQKFFDRELYQEAVRQQGALQFDECFGFVPLLGLGGSKTVSRLQKVKIKEHIALITQALGIVGA